MAIEIHTGIVTNNNDPEQRGRIKFKCDTLLDPDVEYPIWAEPNFISSAGGAGVLFVPDVESTVDIEIDPDDESFTPRYKCGVYSDVHGVPDELKTNYPKRRGAKTPSGHLIIFDDSEGNETILIKDSTGNEIEMKSGQVIVKTAGHLLVEGATIDIGEGASYNVVHAQTLHANLNVQFSMLAGHHHIGNKGKPTSPPIPRPPGFPGAASWSSDGVKVK